MSVPIQAEVLAAIREALPPAARPKQIDAVGPLGGPSYCYRGAVIECQKGGDICTLRMADYPFDGWGFSSVAAVVPLIDLWLEEGCMPKYMQVIPPARR